MAMLCSNVGVKPVWFDSTNHDVRIIATLELGMLPTMAPVRLRLETDTYQVQAARGSGRVASWPTMLSRKGFHFVHYYGAICTNGQTRKTEAKTSRPALRQLGMVRRAAGLH